MFNTQTVKTVALRAAVAATAFGPFAVFAEEVDPTAGLTAKLTQAGVWAAAIGGAVLAVVGAIYALKLVRKAL